MNRIFSPLWLLVSQLAVAASLGSDWDSTPVPAVPRPLAATNCHNLFQVTSRLYSGAEPEGDAAFAELARLGIKTIISVDGAQPAIETARKHGLRYVHLPFGYDSIPSNRVVDLAFAATQAPGPIYLHCHHGKHRGPVAVAVICLSVEGWTQEQATQWLKQAGTSPEYRGLFRSVAEFRPPSGDQLKAVRSLPEVSKASTLVEGMVALDRHWEHLKQFRKNGWKASAQHPDLSSDQEAILLWEHLRELQRLPENAELPVDYRDKLDTSEKAAQALRTALVGSPVSSDSLEVPFRDLDQSCVSCHKVYRN